MHSNVILPVLCATLAVASPLGLFRKAYVYDVTTEIVYVTVTAGQPTSSAPSASVDTNNRGASSADKSAFFRHHSGGGGMAPVTTSLVGSTTVSTVQPTSSAIVVVSSAVPTSAVPATTESSTTAVIPVTSETPVQVSSAAESTTASEAPATVVSTPDTKAAVATAAAAAAPTDFISTALYHHNIHRANHSVPAVTWDSKLASYAAQVASSCVYAHDLSPGGGGYGQNIAAYGSTGDLKSTGASIQIAGAATEMWYNGEVNLYLPSYYGQDNPDFSNFEAWGHFSQMVWKDTTTIGCASVFCAADTIFKGMGSWYSVCNYGAAGNMGGEYGSNVLPPLGKATVHSS